MEPDFPEVAAAFSRTLAADKRKICFFIDGLDEYEGDSIRIAELARYLEQLTRSSTNVKLVVSSRPLHELQDHIQAWPHLMLQDLTSGDILTFVEDKLRKNKQMLRLEKREPAVTAELFNELVSRASGVFLWVHLVVRSLLEGLNTGDKTVDLIVRVRELPTELNELFSVMLGRVNPRHRAQAFRLLHITQQLLPHVQDTGVLAIVLSYAEEYGYTTKALPERGRIPLAELKDRQQDIEVVVRSRCMGMLEVSSTNAPAGFVSEHDTAADSKELATNFKVDYIHRTVVEYLDDMDIQVRVAETSMPTFDVNVAILNALVITCWHGVYPHVLEMFSHFNRQAEQSTNKAQSTAVNELDIYMADCYTRNRLTVHPPLESRHWTNYVDDFSRPFPWHDTILTFAIRCDWELYIVKKLKEHGNGLPAKQGRPLLDYAICPEPQHSKYAYGMNPKISECLLEHGADPNLEFNGYSAWSDALYWISTNGLNAKLRRQGFAAHALQVLEVMKLLLAYGAARRAYCTLGLVETSAAEVVRRLISNLDEAFPQEVLDGLQEVLVIIEDDESDDGEVKQASAISNDGDGGNQIMAASFAGPSRPEPQNTILPENASRSQRIKARFLKRRH